MPHGQFTILAGALPVTGISPMGLLALAFALAIIGTLANAFRSMVLTSLSRRMQRNARPFAGRRLTRKSVMGTQAPKDSAA